MKYVRLLKSACRRSPFIKGSLIAIPLTIFALHHFNIPVVHADTGIISAKQEEMSYIETFLAKHPNSLILLKNAKNK
jgi:hypothetical protein